MIFSFLQTIKVPLHSWGRHYNWLLSSPRGSVHQINPRLGITHCTPPLYRPLTYTLSSWRSIVRLAIWVKCSARILQLDGHEVNLLPGKEPTINHFILLSWNNHNTLDHKAQLSVVQRRVSIDVLFRTIPSLHGTTCTAHWVLCSWQYKDEPDAHACHQPKVFWGF
jgi:hypothetical protein